MVTVDVGGEPLVLLPQKAAFLPRHRALLIADAHVGKAASFRRQGVPVPGGTTRGMLAQIDALVAAHGATRIVFLGDFLHSEHARSASTLEALERWRAGHATLGLTLVRGNHDQRAGDPPPSLGIEALDEPLALGGLRLCHLPRARAGGYVLAGHWHPCVTLSGRALDRLRLPCFWFGAEVGVLPAFGAFTGMHPARPAPGDRLFAVADEAVVPLGSRPVRRGAWP